MSSPIVTITRQEQVTLIWCQAASQSDLPATADFLAIKREGQPATITRLANPNPPMFHTVGARPPPPDQAEFDAAVLATLRQLLPGALQ
jgi:hypothetical protein